jgi:phenylacetate-coenzyme A ligase PaaK-like adenylate-forming protein
LKNNSPAENIFSVTPERFEQLSLDIFRFQYSNNLIYREYVDALNLGVDEVDTLTAIPFLPIQFFKTKDVCSTDFIPAAIFESSGTTGMVPSRHLVKDLSLYEESFLRSFKRVYGDIKKYCILALLPSYLERKNASLVYMADKLIKESAHANSGFYLHDYEKLHEVILENESGNQPTLLLGVSYALLGLAERFPMKLKHTIVMETGGMKGRRKEMTREELHAILEKQLGVNEIHSEYGMTELLSQAYSTGKGVFRCPPWMQILLRAEDDPFEIYPGPAPGKAFVSGAVNIIDLANTFSCSFIATDDMAKLFPDGSFEITGRLENSDIRGCGLMVL